MAQHQFSLRSALIAVAVLCAVIALFVWNAAAALLIVGAIWVSAAIFAFMRTAAVREQGWRMPVGQLLLIYAAIMVLPVGVALSWIATSNLRTETESLVCNVIAISVPVTFLLGLILRTNRLYLEIDQACLDCLAG